jgi:hypothetical protein
MNGHKMMVNKPLLKSVPSLEAMNSAAIAAGELQVVD